MKIRIRNMLDSVAQVGDVDFVGYSIDPTPDNLPSDELLSDLAARCRTVRICRHPSWRGVGRRERLKILQRYFISPTPVMYADFPREPLLTMVEPLAREADMIWVERLYVAHWLRHHGSKTIVDVDDLDSVKLARQIALSPSSLSPRGEEAQVSKLAREERHAVSRFARLVVCSDQDRAFWPSVAQDRVWVVPNGADDRLFDFPRRPKVKNRLVFVGAMGYPPNVDAVKFFCADILPKVALQVPDVTLWIVGKSPAEDVLKLDDGVRVRVAADVPDVAPYVQEAAISVVPLRVGGGTRLKILESLALGTPVVSTTIGAEGLDLADGRDLVIADTSDDFACEVIELLRQEDRFSKMADSGMQTVFERYAWSKIRKTLSVDLQDWCENRGLGL